MGCSSSNSSEVLLSTKGKGSRVILNPDDDKETKFSAELLDNFQVNSGVSANFMNKVTNLIRVGAGRSSIPPYYKEHMSDNSQSLAHLYHTKLEYFNVEGSQLKEERYVVWADSPELFYEIINAREIVGVPNVKIIADGGQGFLKVCFSVLPDDYQDVEMEGISHPGSNK